MTIQLDFLPDVAAAFMLMFARLGTMIMLLPALGESSIPMRFRLTIALAITLVLYPVGAPQYPANLTDNLAQLLILLAGELVIGFGIGLCARMITAALQIAGVIMANQSLAACSLNVAVLVIAHNRETNEQGSIHNLSRWNGYGDFEGGIRGVYE
ncbi:MAG: flagellar biosynthetic protein FliR, partial [Pseudomonadota bacterium]